MREFDRVILDRIRYRGHDADAIWSDGDRTTLHHARLSIIDLECGGQPMSDSDDRFTIVFNGAVYNFEELRRAYEAAGARFRTHSDTEVILQGFALKGERVVHDLNGMFAFAIWDRTEKRMFLARDRLGKKPLFWSRIDSAFVFASTIDAFRCIEGWNDTLSRAGLVLYSILGGFPHDRTAFAQASALPPASFAWYRLGDAAPEVTKYWRPQYQTKSRGSEARFLNEYSALLADSIRIRLRSDVPIALSFSGGTDSGTIAALAKQAFNVDLACYTIDYDTIDEPSEEVAIAREVARRLALTWSHIQYDYRLEILEGLPGAYGYFDQPCQQLALVYSKRLYDAMKKHCTVVLSGNGADEIFTGYGGDETSAEFDRIRRRLLHVPAPLLILFSQQRRQRWDHYRLGGNSVVQWARADMMGYVSAFAPDAATRDECAQTIDQMIDQYEEAGIETMLDFNMHRALLVSTTDTNYRLPDVTGYAAQVEVRSPYLDHRMVEFAARLPHHFKVGQHGGAPRPKYLPRRFYEKYVGSDIAWAPKKGMGANLRWDLELVHNQKFSEAMESAYRAVAADGLAAEPFRRAYRDYCDGVNSNATSLPTAGTMMNGFMLGSWLKLKKPTASAKVAG